MELVDEQKLASVMVVARRSKATGSQSSAAVRGCICMCVEVCSEGATKQRSQQHVWEQELAAMATMHGEASATAAGVRKHAKGARVRAGNCGRRHVWMQCGRGKARA